MEDLRGHDQNTSQLVPLNISLGFLDVDCGVCLLEHPVTCHAFSFRGKNKPMTSEKA